MLLNPAFRIVADGFQMWKKFGVEVFCLGLDGVPLEVFEEFLW